MGYLFFSAAIVLAASLVVTVLADLSFVNFVVIYVLGSTICALLLVVGVALSHRAEESAD